MAIKVVMFDLGETLIDSQRHPFPHVMQALDAIATFRCADGSRLRSCLVSDFTMLPAPASDAKVRAVFKEYLALLEPTGLRPSFEPTQKRITLSTQAGERKPAAAVFRKALLRLGVAAELSQCLLITENTEHVRHVREQLKMSALRFAPAGGGDFADWSEAPSKIAALVAPAHTGNAIAAVGVHLAARGMELVAAEPGDAAGRMQVSATAWHPVPMPGEARAGTDKVHVAIALHGVVVRKPDGAIDSSALGKPTAEQLTEARNFLGSLAARRQIAGAPASPIDLATHEIQTGDDGKRRLVRRGYSAL
jgi:hypothetical protein